MDAAANRKKAVTREWWEKERGFFKVYASRAVEGELAMGKYPGKERALAEVRRLSYLQGAAEVRDIAERLLEELVVPKTVPGDALQLAFALVYRVDYLLSWNRAHLLGEITQGRLAKFRAAFGLRPPLLVSPESIPKAALGEEIHRRD